MFELKTHGNFSRHPPYTPIDVPDYLLEKLENLHSNPALWYMGQVHDEAWAAVARKN